MDVEAESFSLQEYWGKTEREVANALPESKSEYKESLVVENTKGWKKILFLFDKGKLWSVCLNPKEPITEEAARKRVINDLGLTLPAEHEVRTPGLVAFRDMKGRIETINLIYKSTGAYQQISEISVFFSYK